MTSMNYRETMVFHVVGWGNSYSNIGYDRSNRISELWPLRPDRMEVQRKSGQLIYKYTDLSGKAHFLSRKEVLHIPGLGFNGLIGYSVLTLAREAIALGLGLEEYCARFFGNDARPGIILTHPETLSEKAKENLSKSWAEKFQGLDKKHRLAVLEEGLKVEQVGIPPEDAQFLESRYFSKEDICMWFNVPPHLIQLYEKTTSWGTGVGEFKQGFYDLSLRPLTKRIESNMSMQLLSGNDQREFYFEHDAKGLLTANPEARAEYYKGMFMIGAISRNEIRQKENEDPVPGGDEFFIPLNMVPVSSVLEGSQPPKEKEKEEEEEQKALEHRIAPPEGRIRVKKAYHRLFVAAGERIVSKETKALKRAVKKHLGQRNLRSFKEWMDEFYADFSADIKAAFLQVIRSYAEEMQAQTAAEIGAEVGLTAELDNFIRDYVERYGQRHVDSSLGQLTHILENTDVAELEDALNNRADEWSERRPNKIADRETKQAGEAVAAFVIVGAGYKLVWNTAGKSCPYCNELNGRVIEKGQYFVKSNSEMNPEGVEQPLAIYSSKRHPPLHSGCDCFVGAG